jgi:peptide/nickel transport system permease protein
MKHRWFRWNLRMIQNREKRSSADDLYSASQWTLMRIKFRDHKLAVGGLIILLFFYLTALFAPVIAPYDSWEDSPAVYAPPTIIHLFHNGRLIRPYVNNLLIQVNPETFERKFIEDTNQIYPIRFFISGSEYHWLGIFRSSIHLFGVEKPARIHLMGTDMLGRDCFSRSIIATQISLTVGLLGVAVTFILGCIIGGLAGYYGGLVDHALQRFMEFVTCIPTIPMWMALSATIPSEWSNIKVYFAITIILALRSWTGLSRQVRSKLLQLREEDFVLAAKVSGTTDWNIILTHLLPGFMSYLIVNLTLEIPKMILGETTLSFLSLGLRPPTVSWGVLLQEAQNLAAVSAYPWLMFPALMVILTVLAFNFVGDGLRDAADPYRE